MDAISGPMAITHISTKDATLRGFHIPKGTWVLPQLHAIMFDEKLWKDPNEFRPGRFLDSSGKFVVADELINFGIGKWSVTIKTDKVTPFFYATNCIAVKGAIFSGQKKNSGFYTKHYFH